MTTTFLWLFVFVAMYWAYCISWGVKGALKARTASDYFLAGRTIPVWVYVLAATATSFSGWTFIGHPGLIYRDGFQYAFASFYAITIPFTGVIFMKRQWILGKKFGFVTPGEMFAAYFKSDFMRILSVIVALVFSIPYLGIQLRASGFLFNILTDGLMGVESGMWLLSIVVILYVALGGLMAVAYVDTMQCLLLVCGIIVVGLISLWAVGGVEAFLEGIRRLTTPDVVPALMGPVDAVRTEEGYSHYLALPGMIQLVKAGTEAAGGAWTGIMCLSYMFALMGIQSSPAFSMWAFSNLNPKPFAPQQVLASSVGIGIVLLIFPAITGIGGHMIGADPQMLKAGYATDVLQVGGDIMLQPGKQESLVPAVIRLLSGSAPWMVGFLAICALAAMQSTGAAYMSTAGAMVTRDIYMRFLNPSASNVTQLLFGRVWVVGITSAALLVATTSEDAIVLLGGLAVAYGFQMWPALIATCWWPWLTSKGVISGLFAGLIAVTLTESIGQEWLGITWWGRWPLTIHSAGWGILFNLGITIAVSALTQDEKGKMHRLQYHRYLREYAGMPKPLRRYTPFAWCVVIFWFFFAIGPGAVIGNTIFGNPNNSVTWLFGIPSIWAWQIIWWFLGVGMMWFLAYKLKLSTMEENEIRALLDDVNEKNHLTGSA